MEDKSRVKQIRHFSSEKARLAKNKRISESGKATRERRRRQVCRVFDLKVSNNHLSKVQKESLTRAFLEAKWIRNDALSKGIFDYVPDKSVDVLVGDVIETRPITCLGSQMKQSVVTQLKNDVRGIAALKKRGHHIGKLRYKSVVNSIDLVQYGMTYRFANEKRTRVKIQKIPGTLRVNGIRQIPDGAEFANAKLVRKPDGYHIMVTTFLMPDSPYAVRQRTYEPDTTVGVDMGLKTSLTLSDGSLVSAYVEETNRLRRLQKKLTRQKKDSRGYWNTRHMIRREYQRMSNRRDDIANKLVRGLMRNEMVFFQDENISSWRHKHGFVRGGRKIQHSVLGRVKARLKDQPRAYMLDRFVATTQTCPVCGTRTKHMPGVDTFVCGHCGYTADRDWNAACNMIRIGYVTKVSSVERRPALDEMIASTDYQVFVDACASQTYINGIRKQLSLTQEAPRL